MWTPAAQADLIGGATTACRRGMASAARGKEKDKETLSPRAARAKLEEDLGKLDISDIEATPLVIDDREEEVIQKWMLAGKVLYRDVFQIQAIDAALRPAWGNPEGLFFRSLGENYLRRGVRCAARPPRSCLGTWFALARM